MSIVAIIPARGGSARIPRKNIRDFKGQPMMRWPITIARDSMLFDDVVVSTDDDEIADYAYTVLRCSVHRRPKDDGSKGTQEVARDVLWNTHCDMACVIYPCSPMLRMSDLRNAYAQLHDRQELLFAMSVLIEPVLADAGMFYFGRRSAFVNRAPLLHWHTAMIPIHPSRGIDINTEADWARAERMFDALRATA